MKRLPVLLVVLLSTAFVASATDQSQSAASVADLPGSRHRAAYIQWLAQRSMLHQAQAVAQKYSGNAPQWQHPYGEPQPRAAVARASVWFTAYPASTITASPGSSVLATLADERLWRCFQAIGIQG